METIRLAQFSVLVETGNLRKASQLLGISHSGLSKSMKALQDEIGLELFYQNGRGIVISDKGKILYERSKKILKDIDALSKIENERASHIVRIGSFETFTNFFIGPLLKNHLPDYEVEVHELIPGRLEEALANNKVDIGITYEPLPRKGIEYLKVTSLTMGTYIVHGHFQNIPIEDIPFIAPVIPLEGTPSGVKGQDAWPDEKIKRNVRYRVDLLSTGLELARQGLGAIFIPRFVAELHNENVIPEKRLDLIQFSKKLSLVKRDIYIVKRESSGEDKTIKQIAKALRMICH